MLRSRAPGTPAPRTPRRPEQVAALGLQSAQTELKAAEAQRLAEEVKERTSRHEEEAARLRIEPAASKQAREQLDDRTANRWIQPQKFTEIAEAMEVFRGQKVQIAVFPVNFEAVGIAGLVHG